MEMKHFLIKIEMISVVIHTKTKEIKFRFFSY